VIAKRSAIWPAERRLVAQHQQDLPPHRIGDRARHRFPQRPPPDTVLAKDVFAQRIR
jgi:hypothetical protein